MVRAGAGSSARCLLEYVKVAFFRGASLRPVPPAESEQKDVRTLDIHEDGRVDEAQFSAWVSKRAFCPANECERAMRGAPRGVSGRQIICLASPTKAAAKALQAHYAFRSGGQTEECPLLADCGRPAPAQEGTRSRNHCALLKLVLGAGPQGFNRSTRRRRSRYRRPPCARVCASPAPSVCLDIRAAPGLGHGSDRLRSAGGRSLNGASSSGSSR